jgi:hypothetical protein
MEEKEEKYSYTYPDDYWNTKLPINGNIEAFLRMGIEFSSFAEGDTIRDAKLPYGWSKVESRRKKWYHILDDRGRVRGKAFESDQGSFMHPERRFSHGRVEDNSNTSVTFDVWDNDVGPGETRKTVFSVSFPVPNKSMHRQIHEQKAKQYADQEHCVKWLNKYLPKWNDYCTYWGEEINFAEMK